ncbi:MAG: hypothetical protein KKB81_06725 [Candidatus Margulisbacteria bacterium]|nr:hypothetical protein [Candidatus Margulisiibacteriota bacterium]MBU1022491.1 hypothetical protein [Candidatus Margulisiibacteriota bacterium]MBU1728475.1 hypothetical protein [Candidatus Margulisiibacteriota bacterium]MBU1954622.1 hypothetical protein [Candidatus Margulisiibacteriota bacterium]
MKKVLVLFLLCCLSILVTAMAVPTRLPQSEQVYLFHIIDDYEDGDAYTKPKWWNFDNASINVVSNDELRYGAKEVMQEAGLFSLRVTGEATQWYVGGFGTYIAKDASKYTHLSLEIYGTGPNSGTLKIELYDDDNANSSIEQDPAKRFDPLFDDRFVYELNIDWIGWKKVLIPFEDFVDENPKVGDDVWNPDILNGSGGLVQTQLIVTSAEESGTADFCIGSMKLVQFEE